MKHLPLLYTVLGLLGLWGLLVTPTAQAQDISINILGTTATLPLSTTGSIQVDLCNTDPSNVTAPINKLSPQISVGPSVTILGVTNLDGSPLTTFAVSSNTGQSIRLSNSVVLTNVSCLSFKVIIRAQVVNTSSNPETIEAMLGFAGTQTVGNKAFNDMSTTSVAVVANPELGFDLTPTLYARPSTVYGGTPVNVVVDIVELNAIATSGLIQIKVSRDANLNLVFSPALNLLDTRPVQNSAWSFDDSDPDYYILSTSQVIAAEGQLSFGLSGTLSPGATSGILNISSVIVNGGGEQKITNNISTNKIEYFNQ